MDFTTDGREQLTRYILELKLTGPQIKRVIDKATDFARDSYLANGPNTRIEYTHVCWAVTEVKAPRIPVPFDSSSLGFHGPPDLTRVISRGWNVEGKSGHLYRFQLHENQITDRFQLVKIEGSNIVFIDWWLNRPTDADLNTTMDEHVHLVEGTSRYDQPTTYNRLRELDFNQPQPIN